MTSFKYRVVIVYYSGNETAHVPENYVFITIIIYV